MSLDEIVDSHYQQLNENDIYIWQYIYHHKEGCQKMSIQQLAKECNVSHTSIIRFAKKLGLDGYSELKIYLKWDLNKKIQFDQRIMNITSEEFKDTVAHMQVIDFDNIFKIIDESRYIYIVSTGEVQRNVAQELKREFITLKKVMYVIEAGNEELDIIVRNISKEDAMILISFSGNNETIVTLAKILKKMHVPTIGIAHGERNLLSSYVDEYIYFNATELNVGIQVQSYCCTAHFFLIVNMLFLRYLEHCYMKEEQN